MNRPKLPTKGKTPLINPNGIQSIIRLKWTPANAQIIQGKPVTIEWNAENVESLHLIEQPEANGSGFPAVPWNRLEEAGKKIPLKGKITLKPAGSTVYVFAGSGKGIKCHSTLFVSVQKDPVPKTEPVTWSARGSDLDPPIMVEQLYDPILCMNKRPAIRLGISHPYVFIDQSTVLSWKILCATSAEEWVSGFHETLTEDLVRRSGTRLLLIEMFEGWIPPMAMAMRGEEAKTAPFGTAWQMEWEFNAENSSPRYRQSAVISASFIPRPDYEGFDDIRRGEVEKTLLSVYEGLSLGWIRDNAALDGTVRAFREHRLSRTAVWSELIRQLDNLNLITFVCRDVTDGEWNGGGRFIERTNTIELLWSPGHAPSLPYVILHELLHKSGFNGDLLGMYPVELIEEMTRIVATSCFE